MLFRSIIDMLHDYGVYNDYQDKLRMAAFKAMQKNTLQIEMDNE